MKEKYQTEYQSKQRMLDEVGMLRGEIQRNVENEKSFIKAQGMAQEQVWMCAFMHFMGLLLLYANHP